MVRGPKRPDRVLVRDAVVRLCAVSGIVLLSPFLALLGVGVLMTMGRPVMFSQRRVGKGGRTFTLYKLRTMREAYDANGMPLPDSQRTPPFGRLLRRSRLDEIPGLWNVANGDMDLVGPRPLLPETIAALGSRGVARSKVRPGITGWAQVNGNTLLTLDEKVALDLWYIENASAWLDLRILVRTLRVMIGGERREQSAHTAPGRR